MKNSPGLLKRLFVAWAPAIGYTGLIWFVSSLSNVDAFMGHVAWRDKVAHFVEYAILGLLVARAVHVSWGSLSRVLSAGMALLLASVWGVVDEIHQAFVPGRSADVQDVAADFLGALVGVSLWWLQHWIRERRRMHRTEALGRGRSAASPLE